MTGLRPGAYAPAMTTRAVTGIGAGATAVDALAGAGLPGSITRVEQVTVPTGANPSKMGTYIQRSALDPSALGDVPEDLRAVVGAAAVRLAAESGLALAVDMSGSPAGAKTLARLGPVDPAAVAWLVFALVDQDCG